MISSIKATLVLLLCTPLVSSLPTSQVLPRHNPTTSSSVPQVFAHYMLVTRPISGNYTSDITLAASAGISAFALNYGGDDTDFDTQTSYLTEFYDTVADLSSQDVSLNFKLFISIDTTAVTNASLVVSLYNQFASSPAQLRINGKPVLSSFQINNPAWNWQTDIVNNLSTPPFFLPGTLSPTVEGALIPASSEDLNTHVTTDGESGMVLPAAAPGVLTWLHPTASMASELITNKAFSASQTSDLAWMAPVSPWFFKRLSSAENWAHAQNGGIFINRFASLLSLPNPPQFIELVTWNDFGESTYFGPADDGTVCADCYYDTLDHSAFLTMAKPFISAFTAGSPNVSIAAHEENVYMFYRTQPALALGSDEASSPAGDLGLPMNATEWTDQVFVVGMLNQSAEVVLNTGGKVHTVKLEPGVSTTGFAWDFGAQSLDITFKNGSVVSKKGSVPIVEQAELYTGNVVAA